MSKLRRCGQIRPTEVFFFYCMELYIIQLKDRIHYVTRYLFCVGIKMIQPKDVFGKVKEVISEWSSSVIFVNLAHKFGHPWFR